MANFEGVQDPDGTTFGKSGGKIGFLGTAPTVKATVTTTVGAAVVTTAPATSSYGYTEAQAAAIIANINALRVDLLAISAELRAKGFIA